MEPLPFNEPTRPPALSYESPLRFDTAADRHQIWAERTRRRTGIARTVVLVAFAIVWAIAAAYRLFNGILGGNGAVQGVLFLVLLFLAFAYVVLTAVGSSARPSVIWSRLLSFAFLAVGCAMIVSTAVGLAKNLIDDVPVYGVRAILTGKSPNLFSTSASGTLVFAGVFLITGFLFSIFPHTKVEIH